MYLKSVKLLRYKHQQYLINEIFDIPNGSIENI